MSEGIRVAQRASGLRVPATLTALSDIAAFVLALAGRARLDDSAAYRLRLAVDELATNVVTHGYGGAGTRDGSAGPAEEILVTGGFDADRLWVRVEDTAPPFDPRDGCRPPDTDVPPERRRVGGLGIHLALTSVDEYAYDRQGGRNVSTLTMRTGPVRP
ncbi:ATP-binding protein [Streptomyces sp. NPDC086080]|uniref:ATP-binding protein n=1 Tax=Streptomyces sp. NPDC086080 TaxID=3365748 RepID=UPI0037CE1458